MLIASDSDENVDTGMQHMDLGATKTNIAQEIQKITDYKKMLKAKEKAYKRDFGPQGALS